jgi:hypothetical protein
MKVAGRTGLIRRSACCDLFARIDVTASVKEKLTSAGLKEIVQLVQNNDNQGEEAIEYWLNLEKYAKGAEEIDFARKVSDRLDQEAKSASEDCNRNETTEPMSYDVQCPIVYDETFVGVSDDPSSSYQHDSRHNTRQEAVKQILEGIEKYVSSSDAHDPTQHMSQLAQRLKYDVAAYVPCTLQRDTQVGTIRGFVRKCAFATCFLRPINVAIDTPPFCNIVRRYDVIFKALC